MRATLLQRILLKTFQGCDCTWHPVSLPVGDSNFDSTHKANQLADFYLGGTKNIVPENFDKITDMFTDAFVTYAVECFAKHAQTTQKVFHYKYVHQGKNSNQ